MEKTRAGKSYGKIVLYNILIFFVLANIGYWSIAVFGSLSTAVRKTSLFARPIPPGYTEADRGWVHKHFVEVEDHSDVYKSYIGWRHRARVGDTIHVEGPYLQRRTINRGDGGKIVYFFGGSTMWGHGSNDAGTIPSQFAALSGLQSHNFAERAYVAHQGLVLLLQLLQDGHRPDVVVFYDGVNDALLKCRRELGPSSHSFEHAFDTTLRRSSEPGRLTHYMAPVQALAAKIALELSRGDPAVEYDCPGQPAKAAAIADNLIRDWQYAKHLVEWHGGIFVGALQPVAYFSQTHRDHLRLTKTQAEQYRATYPLIREKIRQGGEFHDLVDTLDVDESVYIDWSHLTPKGNRYIAARLAEIVRRKGFGDPQ